MTELLGDSRLGRLRAAFGQPDPIDTGEPDRESDRRDAAVALIIRAGDPLDFLLIKRAEHENDPWSGQMALPGGRWELDDTHLLYTAVRETREETGLDLEGLGVPIARLEDVAPQSVRLPKMRIAPFVFAVPRDAQAAVTSAELASVHWVPIDLLRDPTVTTSTRIHFTGFSKVFPSYHVVGEHVWGLTHRILTDFVARYPERL